MSENRSRYSTAPLRDLKYQPPRQPPVRTVGKPTQSPLTHQRLLILLQVMLVAGILPLLFIIALLAKDTRLHWGFVITSAVCLAGMFLAGAFVPGRAAGAGVVHSAMIAVALFAILVTSPPVNESAVQPVQDLASISEEFQRQHGGRRPGPGRETGCGQSFTGSASLAQQKLEQFMLAWANRIMRPWSPIRPPIGSAGSRPSAKLRQPSFTSARSAPLSYVLLDVFRQRQRPDADHHHAGFHQQE